MRESGYYWLRFIGDTGPGQWFVGHYDMDWDIVTITGRLENFEACMFEFGEHVTRKV